VPPLLDDVAVFHHQNPVGIADGGKPVRDDEAGAPLHQLLGGFLDEHFGVRIHGTRRLIENQDFRVGEQGAGNREQLHLPLREIARLLVQDGLVAFRQGAGEVVHMRRLRGSDDLLIRGAGAPVADVLHDGAVEEPRILQDHAKQAAQIRAPEVLDVVPIHQNRAAVHIVEAHEQLDHGGLAGAGGSDDRDALPGVRVEGEVVDDDFIRAVAKAHVPEIHAPHHLLQLHRRFSVGSFLRFGQEFEDALRGGGGLLQDVGDVRNLRQRLGEGADILDESLNIADGDGFANRQIAAQNGHRHVAQIADKVHHREHQPREELRLPRGGVERAVQVVEGGDAATLAVEGFDNHMSAVHLLDVPVDVPQVILLFLEVLLRIANHHADDDQRERHNQQRHERHLPADGEHHHQHAQEGHHGGDDLRQALVEGLADGVHVIGDARKNLSVVGAIEGAQRHTVNLGGDVAAEAIGELHGELRHNPALDVAEQGGGQVKPQGQKEDVADVGEIHTLARTGELRHHTLEEPGGGAPQDFGPDDGEDRGGDGEDHDHDEGNPVRAEVLQQFEHRPAEIAGFLALHHRHGTPLWASSHGTARCS